MIIIRKKFQITLNLQKVFIIKVKLSGEEKSNIKIIKSWNKKISKTNINLQLRPSFMREKNTKNKNVQSHQSSENSV